MNRHASLCMAGKTCLSGSLTPDENSIRHAWQASRHDGCKACLNRYQLSALPSRRILCDLPLKIFFVFYNRLFALTFFTDKPDRHVWTVCVRFKVSGMPDIVYGRPYTAIIHSLQILTILTQRERWYMMPACVYS